MVDTTALVALVVAGVALVVAADQLTQQLMATAYVIRKCDGIVIGGLTKGASDNGIGVNFDSQFNIKLSFLHCRHLFMRLSASVLPFNLMPASLLKSLGTALWRCGRRGIHRKDAGYLSRKTLSSVNVFSLKASTCGKKVETAFLTILPWLQFQSTHLLSCWFALLWECKSINSHPPVVRSPFQVVRGQYLLLVTQCWVLCCTIVFS